MTNDARISPFRYGSQYEDWQDRNCEKCKKAFSPKWNGMKKWDLQKDMTCQIERDLFIALFDDGTIDESIAKRMGYKPKAYTWNCPERDVT